MNRENDRPRYSKGHPEWEGKALKRRQPPPGRTRATQGSREVRSQSYPLINKTFTPSRPMKRRPQPTTTAGLARPRPRDTDLSRQRKRGPWLSLGCFAVILIAAFAITYYLLRSMSFPVSLPSPGIGGLTTSTYTQENQQSFPIPTLTQLQVQNQIGNVNVAINTRPDLTTTTVTTIKKVKATSNDTAQQAFSSIPVTVQAQGSTLLVTATVPDQGGGVFNSPDSVDISIALPARLASQSALTTNIHITVGDVSINGIKGILAVKTDKGDVTAQQVTLVDGSNAQSGIGNVTFNGNIDTADTTGSNSSPQYKISSENGNLNVTLPGSTDVTIDANTNVGKINNDFGLNISNSGGSASYYGPLTSNAAPPAATLVLDVSTGNIDLHKV